MELRFNERHLMVMNVALGLALAYFAYLCVDDVLKHIVNAGAPLVSEEPVRTRPTSRINSRPGYEGIVKRDVFNLAPQSDAPAPVVAEDLHIKLIGTSSLNNDNPYAIIEDATGNQLLFQVGDDIPDAGRLAAVEPKRAIIDRGGQRVAIEMPTDEMPTVPEVGAPAASDKHHRAGVHSPIAAMHGFKPFGTHSKVKVTQVGRDKYSVSRTELLRSIGNPATLMVQMHATPNLTDAGMDGYTLGEIAPDSTFADMGIQQGDVLTSINGKPINNQMQTISMLSQIQSAPSVDFGLTRGGSPMKIHIDIH